MRKQNAKAKIHFLLDSFFSDVLFVCLLCKMFEKSVFVRKRRNRKSQHISRLRTRTTGIGLESVEWVEIESNRIDGPTFVKVYRIAHGRLRRGGCVGGNVKAFLI